jgi:hypothetical protein
MRTSLVVGLCVCLIGAIGPALQRVDSAPTSSPLAVRAAVRFRALGGMEVVLRDADPTTKLLTFDIRGPEVTRLPGRTPISFHFDVPIERVTLLTTSPALTGEMASDASLVTCMLTRDPSAPPQPWHATIQVALAELPRTGRIIAWNEETHHVTFVITAAEQTVPSP